MASHLTETDGTTTKKESPKAAGTPRQASGPRKDSLIRRMRRYWHEVIVELKKTTWPSKTELSNSTKVVLGTVTVVGVYIAVIDWLLSKLTVALGFWK